MAKGIAILDVVLLHLVAPGGIAFVVAQWDYYSLGKRYLFLADFWFLIALFLSSVLFFPIADANMFIAWLISVITGYALSHSAEESNLWVVLQSLLVVCAVLAVSILIDVAKEKLAQKA